MAASLAVRISLDWSARSLSAREWWPSSVEPLGMILHATYRAHGIRSWARGNGDNPGSCCLTCSPVSFLSASLTLPILPAPMVLPRTHIPDCVGIVVRDRDCLDADADGPLLASATPPWGTGPGPALCVAAEGAMSVTAAAAVGGGGAPWAGWWPERWLVRRWGREGSGWTSLLGLR